MRWRHPMEMAAKVLVGLVAVIHVLIGVFEIFLWTPLALHKRLEPKVRFEHEAKQAAPIVANAGLYNWFVAAGLVWSLLVAGDAVPLQLFFLACVAVAGIF